MSLTALLDQIRGYHPNVNADLIRDAYEFARERHEGQKRKSGDAFIEHPLAVASIVAELKLDEASIAAALLHDTGGETGTTLKEVRERFGEGIAIIVDGVTALSSIHFRSREHSQAENFRKMIVAMSRDIRVLLVKLADRLHNMRTLQHLPPEDQQHIARETLDIYAPLANRLGIALLKGELEDLAFRFLEPEEFSDLRARVARRKRERQGFTDEVVGIIRKALDDRKFNEATVLGRAKHFYSIYRKMQKQGVDLDQIYDLIAFRVIVDTIPQCYEVLGLVHTIWRPIPGRFKDYIALPKPNGYQSLHTAVIGPYGEPLEVQIRTREMHRVAEEGIAAHWKYKEGRGGSLSMRDEEKFAWLKQLVEWQQELRDPTEFLDTVKVNLFADEVYIFTPKGDVKVLPKGSTPVDFAYEVHTEVGNTCVGAKVNGRIVPLSTVLRNGDRLEILTQKSSKPNRDWLKFVKSSRAKNKIRTYVRLEQRRLSHEIGQSLLEKELRKLGKSYDKLVKTGDLGKAAREFKCQTIEDLSVRIGYNRVDVADVLEFLFPPEPVETPPVAEEMAPPVPIGKRKGTVVHIDGMDDLLLRFARCCKPVPGDEIVGFVTRGRGVTVHLGTCPFVQSQDEERLIPVEWDQVQGKAYDVQIRVSTIDRQGILNNLTDAISRHGVNITGAVCRTTDGKATNTFSLAVNDISQLKGVIRSLERLKGVHSVERIRG